jgi:hypothetical protein
MIFTDCLLIRTFSEILKVSHLLLEKYQIQASLLHNFQHHRHHIYELQRFQCHVHCSPNFNQWGHFGQNSPHISPLAFLDNVVVAFDIDHGVEVVFIVHDASNKLELFFVVRGKVNLWREFLLTRVTNIPLSSHKSILLLAEYFF